MTSTSARPIVLLPNWMLMWSQVWKQIIEEVLFAQIVAGAANTYSINPVLTKR